MIATFLDHFFKSLQMFENVSNFKTYENKRIGNFSWIKFAIILQKYYNTII